MEKIISNEESMNFAVKQQVLKRIISLKKSPFVRPQLPGFLHACMVTVFNMVIDRSKLDSFASLQNCYNYVQVASKTGEITTEEFMRLINKLVYRNYDFIMDSGANEGLDEDCLSVMAVSYSGTTSIRKERVLPEKASDLERLLLKGRLLCHGYKDENGKTAINMKQGCQAYCQAADMGAPEALFEMGVFYHHGIECEKDSRKAKTYLEAAANSASARWSCMAMSFALEHRIELDIV